MLFRHAPRPSFPHFAATSSLSISGLSNVSPRWYGILLARVLREAHFVAGDGSGGAIAPDELKR